MSPPWALLNDGNVVQDGYVSGNSDEIDLHNPTLGTVSIAGATLTARNQSSTVTPLQKGGALIAGNALGNTATDTTQQAFSVDEKFNSGFFFASVTYELKETGTLTWTAQTQNTITNAQVTTDTLYIQGPPCVGSPCNPGYVSPAEYDVYQDNLYGTFMFNPEAY